MEQMILFEDEFIIVCHKPAGFPVQSRNISCPDMERTLLNYLVKKGEKPYISIIHRLDQPVEGILVFAKTKEAAGKLNSQMQKGDMEKYYLAVTCGIPDQETGMLEDELEKDEKTNMSRVVAHKTSRSKKAALEYKTIKTEGDFALVEIHLLTGRHHQIRVQLSHAGWPLWGDLKYNPEQKIPMKSECGQVHPALCAYKLRFRHPFKKKKLEFQVTPSGNFPIV